MSLRTEHLLASEAFFLGTFLVSRTVNDFPSLSQTEWKLCLGTDPAVVTQHFRDNGLIIESSLFHQLELFSSESLKEFARQYALPESGTKTDLIRRLLQSEYNSMTQLLPEDRLFECSEEGIQLFNIMDPRN